jgi:hypothetical protein
VKSTIDEKISVDELIEDSKTNFQPKAKKKSF